MTETVDGPWSPPALRRFLLVFAVICVVLLAPWPRWGRVFSAVFTGYGNFVVGLFAIGFPAEPGFVRPDAADRRRADVGEWTVLLAPNDGDHARAMPLDTRILGYTPFAIFAALIVATPVVRRRKLRIAVGGAAILLARLAAAIALPVARSLGPGGPSWARGPLVETIWFALLTPPAMAYVTAAFAWWLPLALTTRPALKGGGQAGSARTRASRPDRGKTAKGASGRPPRRG